MLSGSVQMVKGRIRPITCKVANNSSGNSDGQSDGNVQKPQTSAGVAARELQKCRTSTDKKGNGGGGNRAKPISTEWSKSQSIAKSSPQKNFVKELNGLSSDVAKVLREEGYVIGKSIGEGSYCKVRVAYKSFDNGPDKKIACKMIDKRKASDDFVVKFLPRELGIIKRLSHPNIVSVFDVFEIDSIVFIFMEICEHGDLLDYIRNKGALPENRAKNLFRQIVSAVEYLHSLDIAHRDLKCENVLLAKRDLVKITDFGFARWCKNDDGQRILSETFCGSAAYAAPEIIQGHAYNPKMYDIWSLGCVLYIMLTATMPFDDSNVAQMLEIQLTKSLTFPSKSQLLISPLAKKLVMHLLAPDVTRRATLAQITKSFWLQRSCTLLPKMAVSSGKR
ncbi:UNVERIFIED_CONTAM: hypothetical protein PYX00_008470 [Menopon gallinae]|uniref:Protein kinase domain-containing protein n=1 Tax=Menopon gallinae TaxID=328185 RepID=A0AAW2HN45_9NEOP